MMMVNVDADEFTNSSGAPQFAKLRHKAVRVPCKANYSSVNIDHKRMSSVDFRPCGKRYICQPNLVKTTPIKNSAHLLHRA